MPISTRPSIESFINKGGSSSAAEEAAVEKQAVVKTPTVKKRAVGGTPKKSKSDKIVQPAMPTAAGKTLGRPRKVVEFEALKFVMRIPPEISSELDTRVSSRKIPVSRNAWILEAIVEKLDREIIKT